MPANGASCARILSSLTELNSNLEARDGTKGKSRTRARLCRAKEARDVLARGARLSRSYTDATLAVLVPKEGISSPLLLQCVPELKGGKNRMHLDIVVDDIEAEVHRLQELALIASTKACRARGNSWVRMSDPEQNEVCVSTGVEW